MSDDLSDWTKKLSDRSCFSEKTLQEPIRVVDIGAKASQPEENALIDSACFTEEDLDGFLTERSRLNYKIRIYSICQKRSFTSLYLTDAMFRHVMETHDVTIDFCELVERFRQTIDHRTGESCCGPQLSSVTKDKSEIAYIFKYPESNGRTDGADPWSLRQTAVYQQYDHQSKQTLWILVHPYARSPAWNNLVAYMKSEMPTVASNETQLYAHSAILSSYLSNWKPYLLFYEETVSSMSSTLLGTKIHHSIEYNHDSLARLRYIQARCLPLDPIFAGYRRTLVELSNLSASLLSTNPSQVQTAASFPAWARRHKQRVEAYQDHSEALKSVCAFAVELLKDRLELKQNSSVFELTKLTVDDSTTVKVITIITLAFLSFTVIATIMELPFFHLEHFPEILEVSPQFWIYLAISIPLTILTIAYWRFALWLKTKQRRKRFPPEEDAA